MKLMVGAISIMFAANAAWSSDLQLVAKCEGKKSRVEVYLPSERGPNDNWMGRMGYRYSSMNGQSKLEEASVTLSLNSFHGDTLFVTSQSGQWGLGRKEAFLSEKMRCSFAANVEEAVAPAVSRFR